MKLSKGMKPDDMSVETANKAYLLLTSGVSLLMLNNKYDSISTLRLISAAIRCAEENVEAAEEETQH